MQIHTCIIDRLAIWCGVGRVGASSGGRRGTAPQSSEPVAGPALGPTCTVFVAPACQRLNLSTKTVPALCITRARLHCTALADFI